MLNSVHLQGRLAQDPELKIGSEGKKHVTFTVAVTRNYNRDETDFIDCIAFGSTADFINNWFSKGKPVVVEGALQTHRWTDKHDQKRKSYTVVVERAHFTDREREKFNASDTDFVPLPDEGEGVVPF